MAQSAVQTMDTKLRDVLGDRTRRDRRVGFALGDRHEPGVRVVGHEDEVERGGVHEILVAGHASDIATRDQAQRMGGGIVPGQNPCGPL